MEDYKSRVGKKMLKILMFSMYPDSKIIYREYVQNALDAIRDAVKNNVLEKMKDGHIAISIEQEKRTVIIEDNGIGVPSQNAAKVLLDIADSDKDGVSTAGLYGIGRLVGAGYCKRLSFETSAKGEDVKTVINIDVELVEQMLNDKEIKATASEVMDAVSSEKRFAEAKEEHYFRVILSDVKETYPELLDEAKITEYLEEVAPIDFGMPFKNRFVSSSEDRDLKEAFDSIPTVRISINKKSDIRKRYGLSIEGTGDKIEGISYLNIVDPDFGQLAWGWFAISKFSIQIKSTDNNRGLRLRKHNIQIGDKKLLTDFFSETRGNFYFYGEIHITSNGIDPEGGRSGLAPTLESERLKALLKKEFNRLKTIYTTANRAKNAVKDIEELTRKAGKHGYYSPTEIDSFLNNIEAKKAEFKKLEASSKNDPALAKVISLYNKDLLLIKPPKPASDTQSTKGNDGLAGLEEASSTTISDEGSHTPNGAADENDTSEGLGPEIEPGPQPNPPLPPAPSPIPEPEPAPPTNPPTTGEGEEPKPPTIVDIFEPLKGVLSDKEIFVIRRVFKSLSDNCPENNIKLLDELKRMVIKDLTKQHGAK